MGVFQALEQILKNKIHLDYASVINEVNEVNNSLGIIVNALVQNAETFELFLHDQLYETQRNLIENLTNPTSHNTEKMNKTIKRNQTEVVKKVDTDPFIKHWEENNFSDTNNNVAKSTTYHRIKEIRTKKIICENTKTVDALSNPTI